MFLEVEMKEFSCKFKGKNGMHARPAGGLVKIASNFSSDIKIECHSKITDAKKLFSVMGMGIKYDDYITIKIEGSDEIQAERSLRDFFDVEK